MKIIRDRKSGESKGFGFVAMRADPEGDRAVTRLNGRVMNGRALAVHAAPVEIPVFLSEKGGWLWSGINQLSS